MPQRLRGAGVLVVVLGTLLSLLGIHEAGAAADPCSGLSAVACENLRPGTPASVWDVSGAGDDTLEGFATDMSVNAGQQVSFKIKSTAAAYTIDIYRLGWYQGNGARKVASIAPSVPLPQAQPNCITDPTTSLVDCGNWAVSATWSVPASAVSGVYFAHLNRPDTDGSSHIVFVVRADTSHSDLVFQTSDPTWQAYNTWGGASFYESSFGSLTGSQARAFKVSYNRPVATRGWSDGRDFLFSNEYPMIRFIERNGYDVSYISGLDTDRAGGLLLNHRVFVSVGHDEYWSGTQRANVEAARDAGVNLAFFSGNEVYWKTRYEPSIDGTSTSYRTLVCYKETWDNAKIDPSPEWTGTWRDPRFSPPSNGGKPENALTGTAYKANFTDLPITVSSDEGRRRLWRNTTVASLTPGTSRALAAHTVGYESDEDLDNGYRQPGQIVLSTTTGFTPQYLQDYGNIVAPGTTTHHLTMYKAASGALVFGAGTVQWAWGLDQNHDGAGAAASPVMQQATINLFADMHAQPTTLMSGMVSVSPSSDTTGPAVTITSPTPGASVTNGATMTVTGTATDVGGGVPAGVEVSTDGGTSWHLATGTTSWTYSYVQHGLGSASVMARGTDDSLNTGAPVTVTLGVACPCSVFGAAVPAVADSNDASAVEVGLKLSTTTNGWITGVRFFKAATNTGTHVGSLWATSGALLARGTFVGESASGWQTLQFAAPVAVTAGTTYVVSYTAPVGHYSATLDAFRTPLSAPPFSVPSGDSAGGNGVYGAPGTFPASHYGAPNYWVDAVFTNVDTFPPVVVSRAPVSGASSVSTTVRPSVTVSEDIVPSSLTMSVTPAGGSPVAGAVSYDPTTRSATFTPGQPLANGTTHTVVVGATDLAGNAMTPAPWSFQSAQRDQSPGVCPCTLWNDSVEPTITAYPDASANELGLSFSAQVDGLVTGVRFYKGLGNSGTHTGSLWSTAGTRLATGTFTNETTQGWQSLTFTTPVSITAGTTYVVSYYAPSGHYAVDINTLANVGVTNAPLIAPRNGASYRAGNAGFPANVSGSNYWVQPVFTVPTSVKPTVSSTVPSAGTVNAWAVAPIKATFGTLIQPGSAAITVTGPGGTAIGGTAHYDVSSLTLTFTPSSALADGTVYQVTVNGALSLSGTAMDPLTYTFTTAGATVCPCTVLPSTAAPGTTDSGDPSAISVGVKFTPSINGNVRGVRFYKAPTNTGTHTGSLWNSAGQRLATGTFSGESASGWQTLTFTQAVDVVAGQTYVVSYYAPNGHYSVDLDAMTSGWTTGPLTVLAGANGVYAYGSDAFPTDSYRSANYWVDPIIATGTAPDVTPPAVLSGTPVASSSSVAATTSVSATFSEPMNATSVGFTVKDSAGVAVAGSTAYDAPSKSATFTPTAALARGVTFTVSVTGTDVAGNVLGTSTWSFTTMQPSAVAGVCPCSLWDDTAVPAIINVADGARVELGVRFSVDRPTLATGVRFFKGSNNPGPHVGTLWSAAGTVLAQATFTAESTTGWQTASFSAPVTLSTGTAYVVSYLAPSGGYSATVNGLSANIDASPVHAAAGSALYTYGGGFPTNASSANYWVDPVVTDIPPVVSTVVASPSGSSLTVTWSTDIAASTRVDYGTSASALSSNVTGTAGTSHSVTITGLAPNTKYYYRVSSASYSATTTSPAAAQPPAVFAPVPTPFVTDTAAEFNLGAASNTTVGTMAGGVLTLTPTFMDEFGSTALGSGWSSSVLDTGGTTTVAGGLATLTGTQVLGTSTYTTPSSVALNATLSAADQRLGWYSASPALSAVFGRDSSGNLVALTVDAAGHNTTSPISGTFTAGPHEYRVDWSATTATYFIDGVQVATAPFVPGTTPLRIIASDDVVVGGGMPIDWVRVAPFSASGTYTSTVLDAGAPVVWDGVAATAAAPAGTTLTLRVRSGNTATPDGTWSAWATVPVSGSVNLTNRYLQYQLTLTTTGTNVETPTASRISVTYHVRQALYTGDITDMEPLRAAVVGAGYWGPNLVRNFRGSPHWDLVAVCSPPPFFLPPPAARARAARGAVAGRTTVAPALVGCVAAPGRCRRCRGRHAGSDPQGHRAGGHRRGQACARREAARRQRCGRPSHGRRGRAGRGHPHVRPHLLLHPGRAEDRRIGRGRLTRGPALRRFGAHQPRPRPARRQRHLGPRPARPVDPRLHPAGWA